MCEGQQSMELRKQIAAICFIVEACHRARIRVDVELAASHDRAAIDVMMQRRSKLCPAIFRKQSRHRQSSPSTGIGSRAVSSAHQHGPDRSQVNSVPQPEQARRREAGFSNRFVMNRTEAWPCFSCRVHAERRYNPHAIYAPRTCKGKSDGPRFASRSCRAQSLRTWRARRRVGRFRQCGLRSARLCQSRTEPPQRRAAGNARIAVDAGAGAGGVRLSVRGQAGARGGREIRRAGAGWPPAQPAADAKAQRRNLSLNSIAMDIAGKAECPETQRWMRRKTTDANAAMARDRCRCSPTLRQRSRRSRSTSFRKPTAPRRWRGCSAPSIADCGFTERLVAFWSNHFCISANKGGLARMWAGSFEREAIRPHVLGRFGDMLKAVEQHPAMLFFLDNQQSLGPDSRAGQNRKRGLNENLAREIMELHTLGVGGGYSQDDVTSLARIITGWTFAGRQGQLGAPGSFVFNANAHQPGAAAAARQDLRGQRRRAGRSGAGGYRAPSLHREIHRHQIRASFRRRRSAAGLGGAAAGRVRQIRRRPQGAGDGAGRIPTRPGRRR